MKNNLLMIFVKNLIPGMVKTRLANDIGIDAALDVYMELMNHTYKVAGKVNAYKEVHYSEYVEVNSFPDHGKYNHKIQKGNNLGEKMSNAFDLDFNEHKRAILIGSDCYELTSELIEQAFLLLEEKDLVVGPGYDGGYYLLGMNAFHPQLFDSKQYSHENVLSELLEEAGKSGLSFHQLPKLNDIDTFQDLKASGMDLKNLGEVRHP